MLIGNFYYEIPTSLPELDATTFYYVAFVFIAFCLARLFKSVLRPIILCVANVIFLYSFGTKALIVASIMALVSYVAGIIAGRFKNKIVLAALVIVEAAVLATYKYELIDGLIMPLGLSFYTFKNISYIVDCYNGKTDIQYNPIRFYAYACFFPCIVAGPINRAGEFFEELNKHETFDYRDAKNGGIQLLLGIFEKVVIAAYFTNIASMVFDNPELVGINALFGLFIYSFAIYLDFDSYSNIAIGTARLFGIHLDKNFNSPYLGYNLKTFWSRWHISLTSWFKDYIYILLGGNRKGEIRKCINILVVFLVSGIWHGSTVNFVLWGMLHGLIRIGEDYLEKYAGKYIKEEKIKKLLHIFGIAINFCVVSFLWLIFRYEAMTEVFAFIERIKVSGSLDLLAIGLTNNEIIWLQILLVIVIVTDILRNYVDGLEFLANQFFIYRWVIYFVLIVVFLIFGVYGGSYDPGDFIYKWF